MGFGFLIQLINIFMIFIIFICIPVLIGVYVYRDASRRGMNAAIWTLVAVLGPTFIGFIIYLFVRSQYGDLECPSCTAPVKEHYVSCPKCGIKLKASCPDCGFPVEGDWSVCPRCSVRLPEWEGTYMTPTVKKDKALGKIIILIVLLPVLFLLLFGVLGFAGWGVVGGGNVVYQEY